MKNTIASAVTFGVGALVVVVFGLMVIKPTIVINAANAVQETLGSASSPSVNGGCMDVNGVVKCYYNSKVRTATTTVCAFKSPSATSTLALGTVNLRVGTSTGYIVHMAKAATFNATTTSLGYAVVAAGAQVTVVASTTNVANLADQPWVFAPNQYFVVGIQGGIGADAAGTGFVPVGTCDATWQII